MTTPKETAMSIDWKTHVSIERLRTSGDELSQHQLDRVTGGRIGGPGPIADFGPGPIMLNPQPLPP
jgi:hypothetical protein